MPNPTLQLLDFLWASFMLLAPMLLLGLFLAGLIHVLISREAILRWLSGDSLKSVCASAAVGVPVPLCSCSVVPVVAEMRKKGASRSSCMSFLITAPETGADSILVTHAFFGFVAAVVRPVVSFLTAVVAGIFCIGIIRDDSDAQKPHEHHAHEHHDSGHDHGHAAHDHGHDHAEHESLYAHEDDCYVSPAQLKDMLLAWLSSVARGTTAAIGGTKAASWVKPNFYREAAESTAGADPEPRVGQDRDEPTLRTVVKHIFRYGFVEVADDILFALLVGVALGGVLFLAIPDDLMSSEYARWISYPVMVVVGIPLYICASASTPIAAALVAKGLSPGAALIFLMTGPATNSGTIAIIVSQFGARFGTIYVGVVIAVTAILGILIDLIVIAAGLTLPVNLSGSQAPAIQLMQWAGALALIALIIWRFREGALKSGYDELVSNLRPVGDRIKQARRRLAQSRPLIRSVPNPTVMKWGAGVLAVLAFLSTGLTVVGPSAVAYGRAFGKVVWRDLPPGLHYLGPRPIVKIDKWPVRQVKNLENATPYEFLSGDLNLLAIKVAIQYLVSDAYTYHYRMEDPEAVILSDLRDELRSFVAIRNLDSLLNVERAQLEAEVQTLFQSAQEADPALSSVHLIKVNLLEIQPVVETMNAFREISSSQDDRERIIVNAQRQLVSLIPKAHGNAAYEIERATGEAFRNVTVTEAEAEAIQVVSDSARRAPEVLHDMLWRERLETALSDKQKIIVPNQRSLDKVALWKRSAEGLVSPPPVQEATR